MGTDEIKPRQHIEACMGRRSIVQAGLELAGRYVLKECLGHGAVGEVWHAYDRDLGRAVAVKVIWERISEPELARNFQREAMLAAPLQHQGITVVHDVGEHDGQPFIVMELLRGRDLQAVLNEAPDGLPVDLVISLGAQAAQALGAAHAGGVIHRDLKPANLFLQDHGQVKICDFGIAVAADAAASLAADSYILGTPAYMSPEQCDGQQGDQRSDLYSLGCVLYALLTGQPPFPAGPPLAVMAQHRTATPKPPRTLRPEIPARLSDLVLALLAKDPARRPASASEVAATLTDKLNHVDGHERPGGRRRPILIMTPVIVAIAGLLTFFFWDRDHHPSPQRFIVRLIREEAAAAKNHDISLVRQIYAPSAVVKDAGCFRPRGPKTWPGMALIVTRYQNLGSFPSLSHNRIKVRLIPDTAQATKATAAAVTAGFLNPSTQNPQGQPLRGHESWTFALAHGRWQITSFTFDLCPSGTR